LILIKLPPGNLAYHFLNACGRRVGHVGAI
jgi:hypothetical protein